jgi:Protein of unknown function (DUF1449)
MHEVLVESLSFPTVVFTVLLGIATVYWILVVAGALGMDMLDADSGGHDVGSGDVGHGDAGHGDAGHGGADAGGAQGDGSHIGHDAGIFATLLGTLKLDAVPTTIVVSMIVFWGWLITHFASHFVVSSHQSWVTEFLLLVAAFVVAVVITSIAIRPIAPLFRTNPAARRSALVGKVVVIDTSRVDAEFGMAKADNGGAGLIVQVRCETSHRLGRGRRALVVSYDEVREVYEVTPLEDILPSDAPDSSGSPS